MPAQEHAFSEELPRLLYVDTDVIVAALVSTEPHYARCAAFFQRLAATATTQLYLSSLCWIECARAVTRAVQEPAVLREMRKKLFAAGDELDMVEVRAQCGQ